MGRWPPDRQKPRQPPRPDAREFDARRSRPLIDMPLDERKEELVRAYVKGEPLPTDPPASSDPPPEDDVATSAPRVRIVEVPPDYTVRPRRTLHQRIKDLHKVWLALVPLAVAIVGALRPIVSGGTAAYQWVHDVNTAMSAATACASAQKATTEAVERLRGELRAEVADAGAAQGRNWDDQDQINQNVHKQLTRTRAQTPPPALGPKAKAVGR